MKREGVGKELKWGGEGIDGSRGKGKQEGGGKGGEVDRGVAMPYCLDQMSLA